jgi:hypothetical protein
VRKKKCIDWLLSCFPWRIHLGFIYTTRLLSLYNSSNRLLSLYISTSWLQRLYLTNFIYLNSSLISTWTLTWLGLQSWTLSWLNFFLNMVFKLNQILWSFSWLRLLDLNQLKLLIFILLGLDLNHVLYLETLLGSDSFRSPPSTRIDPFYLTWIQFISLLNWSCINLMFLCTKRSLTQSKEVSLSYTFLSYPASLPEFLPGCLPGFLPEIVIDSLPESLPESYLSVLPESYPRLCPIPYPSRYLEPYPSSYLSCTWVCYPKLYRVLPGHVPDRVNPSLPRRLPDRVKSYTITYPALP